MWGDGLMQPDDGTVDFDGYRVRPELVGDVVELQLLTDALLRGLRHHQEHGGTAGCGCPLRVDGTDPYLHRDGCPRQGEVQVERWLTEYGGRA